MDAQDETNSLAIPGPRRTPLNRMFQCLLALGPPAAQNTAPNQLGQAGAIEEHHGIWVSAAKWAQCRSAAAL